MAAADQFPMEIPPLGRTQVVLVAKADPRGPDFTQTVALRTDRTSQPELILTVSGRSPDTGGPESHPHL
jgi:hypothetical protein